MEHRHGEVTYTLAAVREARRQIAATIVRERLTIEQAAEQNRHEGWRVELGGATIVGYQWRKGERAIVARMVENERGY